MSKVEWKNVKIKTPPIETSLVIWLRPTAFFQKQKLVKCTFVKSKKEAYFISYKMERFETSQVFAWCLLEEIAVKKESE